jgi:hypothetical protein
MHLLARPCFPSGEVLSIALSLKTRQGSEFTALPGRPQALRHVARLLLCRSNEE